MTKMVKCVLNGEYEIILPKHRADRLEWYTEQGWEKKRLKAMHDHIKNDYAYDPVIYYVGAEEGDMAALCSIWGADVVLFEPNKKVMPNIKAIWHYNKLPECIVVPAFVSDTNQGEYEPHTIDEIEGEVIPDHGFKELRDPADIPQLTIDSLHSRAPVPDIISLDVEGSEGRVLRGAEQTLREYHPTIFLSLHPEFLREQYDEWGAELRRWIIDLGYKETLLDYPLHEVHLMYEAL